MPTDIDWNNPPALRLGCLGLLRDEDGRVLLVEKNYKTGRERFGLPGGCASLSEDARTAARRKIAEELGLEVEPGAVLVNHYMPAGETAAGENVVFDCGTISASTPLDLGEGITAVHWVAPQEVQAMAAPYTAARIAAAIEALDGQPVAYLVGHP